jgi:hypothetical protein
LRLLEGETVVKHLVAFKLEDGSHIVVEVDEPELGAPRRGLGHPPGMLEEAKDTFAQALSRIRPATEQVITTLRSLMNKPDEVEMEFGFRLSAVAGVVIASASTEANYKVTVRWKQEGHESQA